MAYTAISRVRNLEDLALTAFDIDAMYSDSRVESLYDRMQQIPTGNGLLVGNFSTRTAFYVTINLKY